MINWLKVVIYLVLFKWTRACATSGTDMINWLKVVIYLVLFKWTPQLFLILLSFMGLTMPRNKNPIIFYIF